MSHTCHAHGCTRRVPPAMFACKPHWFALRKPMRDAIWREYRPGQENDKKPSYRYLAVQRRAVAELAFKPNDEKSAHVAAGYILESEAFRLRAIETGAGDPLGFCGPPALGEAAAKSAAIEAGRHVGAGGEEGEG